MKKYNSPDEYYGKDKELEKRRDWAVANNFGKMTEYEIYKWADELSDYFGFSKQKFRRVQDAERFIRIYYKR